MTLGQFLQLAKGSAISAGLQTAMATDTVISEDEHDHPVHMHRRMSCSK